MHHALKGSAPLFLMGTLIWAGTTHGQLGNGKVERSYQFVLKGKFIQVNKVCRVSNVIRPYLEAL
jgi:hypothetical protein